MGASIALRRALALDGPDYALRIAASVLAAIGILLGVWLEGVGR